MDHKCPNCSYIDTGEHWNPATSLPPVGLPFLILIHGNERTVLRSNYAPSSSGNLLYEVLGSNTGQCKGTITGRYPWRHR